MIKVLCYYVYMDAACDAAELENEMAKQKTFNVTFWNNNGESLGTVEGVAATTANKAAAAALKLYTPFYFTSFTSEAA